MTQDEIKKVLELHAAWLGNRESGVRAILSGADLSGADLYGANLHGANLHGANLHGANLHGAKDVPTIHLARTSIVPESGQFTGWKKCANNVIVRLVIGKNAKRSNSIGA